MTSRKNPAPPTRAELRILKALWELKSGTIDEIIHHPSFSSPPNYKTTQTILRIMEEKRPRATYNRRSRLCVRAFRLARVGGENVRTDHTGAEFCGSPAKLLVNLLESGPVAEQELEELEALIRNYRIQKGEIQH